MVSGRTRLGILFSYSEGHIAVTYYILNIIKGLLQIEDSEKPHISLFCYKEEDYDKIKQTGYPYLSMHLLPRESKITSLLNKAAKVLVGKPLFGSKFESDIVDVLFPGVDIGCFRSNKKKLYWAGDFQDLYYPSNFVRQVLIQRKLYRNRISYNKSAILFSSYDSQNQYQEHFPKNNADKFVYQFNVLNTIDNSLEFESVKRKFNVTHKYFICPNQFWVHKNHKILLQAIKQLVEIVPNFQLILTGSEVGNDGSTSYADGLKEFVLQNSLNTQVKFLGFIDRQELLVLLKHSMALIQPSFFEGWNTSVEDAKSLDKLVIASNLEVHKEQLGDQGLFFDPNDSTELFRLLLDVINGRQDDKNTVFNYEKKILKSAKHFMDIVKEIKN